MKTSASGFITGEPHETRNQISSHQEKKLFFRGGQNETAHYITVILVWFEKLYECADISFQMTSHGWLRLDLINLSEQKFKYNLQNCLNSHCSYGSSIECTSLV